MGGFFIGIAHMLLLVASHTGCCSIRVNVGSSLEGYIFIGTVLIFTLTAGLAFGWGGFPAGSFLCGFAGVADYSAFVLRLTLRCNTI